MLAAHGPLERREFFAGAGFRVTCAEYHWGLNNAAGRGENYRLGLVRLVYCCPFLTSMTNSGEDVPVVMVLLKAPRPGYVKTRLARDIGFPRATRLYRQLAERQVRAVPAAFHLEVHYAPRGAAAEMRAWLGERPRYRAQAGGDLGRRLEHAFARGFARGAARLLAIGADCPELDGPCLERAAHCLRRCDVVLGPARDGGYFLIGLRRPAPQLFAGIAWSSAEVLAQTLKRIKECGLSLALLGEKEDVDDLESLRRLRARGVALP